MGRWRAGGWLYGEVFLKKNEGVGKNEVDGWPMTIYSREEIRI